jgi:hypothetical protein
MAGWVSLAIFANWSVILEGWGFGSIPDADAQGLAFLALSGATAGTMIVRTRGSLVFRRGRLGLIV